MLFEPGTPVSLKRLNPPWIPNSVSQFFWAAAGAARRRLPKASRWSFLTHPSREVSGPEGRSPRACGGETMRLEGVFGCAPCHGGSVKDDRTPAGAGALVHCE